MGKKICSNLAQMLILVLLLLCTLIYRAESALPSPISITGRRMMAYDPNGHVKTPLPESKNGGKKEGRLMTYKPNGAIFTGPSNSGHGGGHINQASP